MPAQPESRGPVLEFARSLSALRDRAGKPSLKVMAETGYSSAPTLSAVHGGKRFPTWDATLAYLRGCGLSDGEVGPWQERWLEIAEQIGYRGERPADRRAPAATTGGREPCPVSHDITTVKQLREGLRHILRWAGLNSQAALIRRAEQDGVRLARATLSDMLRGDRDHQLPSAANVRLFLIACGVPPYEVEAWLLVHGQLDRRRGPNRLRDPDGWAGARFRGQAKAPSSPPPPPDSKPVIRVDMSGTSGLPLLAGRYQLISRVGAGGMSVVWQATDQVLGRQVAVKVLPPATSSDPAFRRRLRVEAQAAARLNHPHITGVYDYGEATTVDGDPMPFIVMEMVEGESLAAVLARQRRLPWPTVVRIAAEVTSGLAAAHARGIVHRDVTPANVMLTPLGAKVVDFGISALIGENDIDPDGSLLGTPAYLAPERLMGGQVSPATDVYAAGLLIYRSLIGQLPWDVGTTTALLRAHQYVEPDPLPPVDGLPAAVRTLVERCLQKRPEDRPSSAELARGLSGVSASAVVDPLLWHGAQSGEDTTVLPGSGPNYRGRHRR
jgi:hypothetical protein